MLLNMAQFQFILWLAYWYLQADAFEFEWDRGNATKSVIKHGVTTEDVESVFALKLAVPLGRQVSPSERKEHV